MAKCGGAKKGGKKGGKRKGCSLVTMSDGGNDIKLFQLLVQVYSDSGKELKLQKDASSTGK